MAAVDCPPAWTSADFRIKDGCSESNKSKLNMESMWLQPNCASSYQSWALFARTKCPFICPLRVSKAKKLAIMKQQLKKLNEDYRDQKRAIDWCSDILSKGSRGKCLPGHFQHPLPLAPGQVACRRFFGWILVTVAVCFHQDKHPFWITPSIIWSIVSLKTLIELKSKSFCFFSHLASLHTH